MAVALAMPEAPVEVDRASYNEAAIATADALHELRRSQRRDSVSRQRTLTEMLPAHNLAAVGVGLEYDAMGHQPVTDQLARQALELGVRFEHLALTLGTVLHNVDLKKPCEPALVDLIRTTLLERKVIFFRDQHLSEDQQVAFGRCFGELDAFPFGKTGTNPYILEILHNATSPGRENGWHTDVTWMARPSLGSIAQCIEVPPFGGDTLFSDSAAAYLGMPPELQTQLRHLEGINDYRVFLAGRGDSALPPAMVDKIKQRIPFGVSHPLLRTHPENGKTTLYIHGGFLRHDSLYDVRDSQPLGEAVSKSIVATLLQQHSRPEYTCRFQWTPGSIAFWDNRSVQHYAASDYYPHRRLLRRVTVAGDKPYFTQRSPD